MARRSQTQRQEGRKAIKLLTMRREGYIIEEIIDYSNMSESFDEVLRG